jgi:thiosulfate dehydrogenase [quinone] large subunit
VEVLWEGFLDAPSRASRRDGIGAPMSSTRTPGDERGRFWPPPSFSTAAVGWVLLPLRAFLAVTFLFAGLQKLANPGFFDASNPVSIQSQMAEAAQRSPIHALVGPLQHVAVAVGVILALGELAVGLGTLVGLWVRGAAGGGIALSLALFLTVSFHSSPYYTGSDIVFVFAWTPLLVAGGGGVLALDRPGTVRRSRAGTSGAHAAPVGALDRRTFTSSGVAAAVVGAVGLALAGLAAGLGRLARGSTTAAKGATPPAAGKPLPPATTVPRPTGTRIGPTSEVPVGGSARFTDPHTGDPSLVVQPVSGHFAAFDAICPHEGCTVGYSSSLGLFVCPCHGSEFNGRTGARLSGPAPTGLTPIGVEASSDGQLYVT